ncbi:hypothetical protein C1X27_14145 [Pseudomonas sp. MPR-AND1B]|nr:hypothetical protein C1X26_19415 [Pseudomonas sp. MPR-R3A]PMY99217.1 hypothetical protein C1X24_06755 [Pseudomonas sp. FW305-124]PMZ68417.1 hypothetical protein C1X25_23205 [Pseudomonas sp. GW247-3R2A]PNA95252.1 hypothetical protein C1X23_06140 [Pseudomonas sp. FW300-E2]PNB02450.1 hypothetical protein C1X27_14145 [Pseudomonas sp. MPR-AND1B]
MQGQKGYVNGYVVIIFAHYINCRGDGGMRENVTWASFSARWVAGFWWRVYADPLWELACLRWRCVSEYMFA